MATRTLRGLLVTTTAGLLVATSGGLASAGTTHSTSPSIRLVKHVSTSTVSGTLLSGRSQVPNAVVTRVSEPAGGSSWKAVDAARTNAHGLVAFTVSPTARTHYELRFAATSAYRPSHSGVVTATAPTKAVASSLSIRAGRTSLASGEKAQISGVLSISGATLAGRTVTLEVREPGGTWTKERSNQTGAQGRVAFVVAPKATRQLRLRFAGDSVGKPSRSGVVTVFVRTSTSLSIRESQSSINPGGSAAVSGVLLSGRNQVADRDVVLLAKTGSAAWHAVAHRSTGPHGGVAFTVSPAATTQYQLTFARHERYNASHSGVVTLIVRTATSLSIATTSTTVSGTLTRGTEALAGKTVELLAPTSEGDAFASKGTVTTDANGLATFTVAPSVTTEYRLGFDQTPRYLAEVTTELTRSSGRYAVTAAADGGQQGDTAVLQRWDNGAWVTVSTRALTADKAVAFSVPVPARDRRYRVRGAATSTHGQGLDPFTARRA